MQGAPIGIVVVSYHANEDLTNFCWSLVKADPQIPFSVNIQLVEVTPEELEVAEGLVDMLAEKATFAGITTHVDNCGYARACNDGAHWTNLIVDADTYAFFNADTEIRPGVLEHCVQTLWSDDSYAVVGPRQVTSAGNLTAAGIFGTEAHPQHRGWFEPSHDGRYQDIRPDCVTVSGAAYFIKAPVWNELRDCTLYQTADPDSYGAFLQTPHYFEETWCSYHARAHGYKVVYDGAVTMVHEWMGSTPGHHWGAQKFEESRPIFRAACDIHGIEHD